MSPTQPKKEFIKFCIANEALRFGAFTLKSGRVSPYFFNAGLFNRGDLLAQLAQHYANLIAATIPGDDFILFGPAYKGIPLAAATAMQLAAHHDRAVGYAFNRKETKSHGEGGALVGAPLRGQVVIIDDVITAGTSIAQAVATITAADATPTTAILALDREETAHGGLSAVQYVRQEFGIAVHAIVTLRELVACLEEEGLAARAAEVRGYWEEFGVGG